MHSNLERASERLSSVIQLNVSTYCVHTCAATLIVLVNHSVNTNLIMCVCVCAIMGFCVISLSTTTDIGRLSTIERTLKAHTHPISGCAAATSPSPNDADIIVRLSRVLLSVCATWIRRHAADAARHPTEPRRRRHRRCSLRSAVPVPHGHSR